MLSGFVPARDQPTSAMRSTAGGARERRNGGDALVRHGQSHERQPRLRCSRKAGGRQPSGLSKPRVLASRIVYGTIVDVKPIRFSRSARRHKIGRAHAYHVISSSEPVIVTDPKTNQPTLTWIACDSRKRELEIVAIETPDCFLVIHVMPSNLRQKGRKP